MKFLTNKCNCNGNEIYMVGTDTLRIQKYNIAK